MLPSDFHDVVAFEESAAPDDEEWTVETRSDSSGRSNNVVVNTVRSKTQALRPAEPANGEKIVSSQPIVGQSGTCG